MVIIVVCLVVIKLTSVTTVTRSQVVTKAVTFSHINDVVIASYSPKFKEAYPHKDGKNEKKVERVHERNSQHSPARNHMFKVKKYFTPCSSVYIANFEQVNAGWI